MATTINAQLQSMGLVNMWGFSPSFDPLKVQTRGTKPLGNSNEASPINILLVGPSDIRHVLHTIANKRHTAQNRPVNIYMYERSIESLARELLLLEVFFDFELPFRQRCNAFLEIFGNAFIHVTRTADYIDQKVNSLLSLLHYGRGFLDEYIDLNHLKSRSRDDLDETIQSWKQSVTFDVATLRDHRLRHFYQLRYDYRDNLIDWDYTMTLKKIEHASVIHSSQYRMWRNTGIAFEFGDQKYTAPNRTMAAYTEARNRNHSSVLCRGLWTDIIISPYISFGVDTIEAEDSGAEVLFEIQNEGTGMEQNRHNTTEVCIYNLLTFLHSIELGMTYEMTSRHDIYSGIGREIVELADDEGQPAAPYAKLNEDNESTRCPTGKVEALNGIKIVPLTGPLDKICSRKSYQKFFSHVYLSSHFSGSMQCTSESRITDLLRDDAIVSIENSTFLLALKEDQRLLYTQNIVKMCKESGLRSQQFPDGIDPQANDLSIYSEGSAEKILQSLFFVYILLASTPPKPHLMPQFLLRWPTQSQPSKIEEGPTWKKKLKNFIMEYGPVGLCTHLVLSATIFTVIFMLISFGLNAESLLKKLGIHDGKESVREASWLGSFIIAYAIYKLISPLRWPLTLFLAPVILRVLRRKGYMLPNRRAAEELSSEEQDNLMELRHTL
uniref:Uncharacterized protein AlNc14C1G210 n=1 Tax=Albugo laibachii Nc14 TaxID=890382 RepID=F0VZ71_9STRA|nr:conserved hypothetical protein [Albugo laibachii Nc14]|eukprot:CCA14087.1 conserved hypothetical protein [Albugo laibachii Nc14]